MQSQNSKPTFTLAEDAGKVTRISISNEDGGTKRSPFLTAPFTKTDRAFEADKILHQEGKNSISLMNFKLKKKIKKWIRKEKGKNDRSSNTIQLSVKLDPWTVDYSFFHQLQAKGDVPTSTSPQQDLLGRPRQYNVDFEIRSLSVQRITDCKLP